MNRLFTSAALGWWGRRLMDWGGWMGTIVTTLAGLYAALPASSQAAIGRAFQGNWQDLTLGSLAPIALLIFSQVKSFHATTKDQVVVNGNKAALPDLSTRAKVEVTKVAVTKGSAVTDLLKAIFTH